MRTALLLVLLSCLSWSAAQAQERPDSAAFVTRLGNDTTAVERFVRTPALLVAEAVQRSPSTTVHRLQLHFGEDDRLMSAEYQVLPRLGAPPSASRTIRYPVKSGDSTVIEITQGGSTRRVALIAGDAIPVIGPFYAPYELAVQRVLRARADTARVPLLAGTSLAATRVRRLGRDSVSLTNQFNEPMQARIDAQGRILQLHTPAYVTMERTRWVDLERLVADFQARDAAGHGLGQLSPRAASRTRVGEANVWLDYGRPALRGRPLWGALVPFGQVWRLGANDATHFSTDRPVQLGTLALEPGTYTLFLLPASADAWTLVVNRKTGMSGLTYDASADVGRVPMSVTPLPQPVEQLTIAVQPGGASGQPRLEISWGDRRGTVPLQVK